MNQAPRKPLPPQGASTIAQAVKSRVFIDLSELNAGYLSIKTPFHDKDMVKAIPGRQWRQNLKVWEFPIESLPDAQRLFPGANLSPMLEGTVKAHADRIRRKIEAKTSDKAYDIPGLKLPLRKYQMSGIGFLNELEAGEGAILAYDMGLGKSVTSIAFALNLMEQGKIKYAVFICPAALKFTTWEEEIRKFTDEPYVIVDGSKTEKVEEEDGTFTKLKGQSLREVQYLQFLNGTRFMVLNYEMFVHDCKCRTVEEYKRPLKAKESEIYETTLEHFSLEAAIREACIKAVGESKWEEYTIKNENGTLHLYHAQKVDIIPDFGPEWLVVLDEAHRIKNIRAQTTKNLLRKVKTAGYKVLGTGTPLENNIEELFTLVDLCRPGIIGNFHQFKERYCEQDHFGKINGPIRERLPELMERLEPIMIRLTKAEANPDLPELIRIDRWVEMTKDQEKLYKQVKEGILNADSEDKEPTYLEVLAQITRFQQVCDSPALLSKVVGEELPEESGKLIALKADLEEIHPERNKCIIFAQYKEMTNIIVKYLRIWYPEFHTAYFAGGISDAKRTADKNRFTSEEDCRFMVITTAGNYGLNLQAANYVLNFDETFNPQKMEQVISRSHRQGQTQKVTAISYRTRGTYEERKKSMMDKKRGLFSAVIDGDDEAFMKEFSVKELQDLF